MKKQLRPVGIIAAMDREIEALMADIQNPVVTEISRIRFIAGQLDSQEVVMAICGPGKVNAGICAEVMILTFAPRLIIKTGVAGSMTEKIGIGGIVIGERGVQYDIDTTCVGDPPGLVSRINKVYFDCDEEASKALLEAAQKLDYPVLCGTVATGDTFMCRPEQKQAVVEQFGTVACEMEGAAVLQAAYVNETPVALVLSISDEANGKSTEDYAAFTMLAASHNISVIRSYLQSL